MPSETPLCRQRLLLARQPVLQAFDAPLDLPQTLCQLALHAEPSLAAASRRRGPSGAVPAPGAAALDRVGSISARGLLPQVREDGV